MKIIMSTLRAKLCLALVASLSSFGTPALAAEKIDTLRFGLLPTEDTVELIKMFRPVAEHVGKELGLPIKIWVSQGYNALIEAMGANQLDVVYLGGGQYVAALKQGIDVVPIVVTRTPAYPGDTKGRTYYKSTIIARTDSNIRTLADMKGKTFSFVSPTSTSGGIAPRYVMLKNGIDPENYFKRVLFAGTHQASFLAVMNKKVDVGALADHYFRRYSKKGLFKLGEYDEGNNVLKDSELYIITTQKVPGTAISARGALGKEFHERLRNAFQSVPFEIIDKMRHWGQALGFEPTSHEHYEDVAAMKKLAAELKKKQKKK